MNFINSNPRTVSIFGSWLGMMILLFGFLGSPELAKAQYCLAGFDEAPGTGTPDEWIAEVTFADLTNTSSFGPLPPDPLPGYQDFTAQTANVDAGSTYPVSVTPGYEGTAFNESFRVYIDWDQDDIFQEDEGYDLGSAATTVNGTITVPIDAAAGTTRMRVLMVFGTFDYLNGCAPNQADFETFGEAEDYSVNVTIPACLPPTDLTASSVTATDATISWTDVAGDVYLEYGLDPFVPGAEATAGGGTVVGPLASSPEVLSGVLSGSSTYTVYARQDCGGGSWSSNTPVTFNTTCSTYSTPYFESFESLPATTNADWPTTSCIEASPTGTTLDYRWNREVNQPPSGTGSGPNLPHDGGFYAFTESSQGATGDIATLDLGPIDLSALTDPALSFFYHMHGAAMGTLNVYASTDGIIFDPLTSFTGAQQAANTDPFLEQILSLSAYSGETITIRFEGVRGTSFTSDIAIDAISVEEAPACLTPTDLTVGGLTATTADVSWTCAGCTGDFYIEYGAPGFIPGSDALANGGTVVGPFASGPQTLSGLSSATDYEFVVRQDCGVDGFSDNSSSGSFTTTCATEVAPYSEGFEAYAAENGATWPATNCIVATPSNSTAPYRWIVEDGQTVSTGTGPLGPNTGTRYAVTESSQGGTGDVATLDFGLIDLSALSNPALTFFYHMFGPTMGTLNVQVSTDGIAYNTEFSVSGQQQTALGDPWTEVLVPLGAYSGTIYLRFEGIRGTSFTSDISIDDIAVIEGPTCTEPADLALDGITDTDADISWSCGGCAGPFYVEYGAPGFTAGLDENPNGGTVLGPIAGTSTTIPGLTQNTPYDVYVRQDCGALDGFSENAGALSIQTACAPIATFPFTETFEIGSTSRACWTNIQEVGAGDWTYQSGSSGGVVTTAFEGSLNARFVSQNAVNSPITKLVSPLLDLSAFLGAELDFYFAQEVWAGDQNTMGVYYRISPSDPWVLLDEYTESVAAWTNVTLNIPTASATMQVAFEGRNNWGRANVVDLVTVSGLNCAPAIATAQEVPDCALDQFFIDVNVTSLGSDGSFDILSDVNGLEATVNALGPIQIGPYTNGLTVNLTLDHSDPDCVTDLAPISYFCPPPNDDCADATPLALNAADECMGFAVNAYTTAATVDGAAPTCGGAGQPDVWFSFSTGSSPYVDWEIALGTIGSVTVEIWDVCNGTSLYCASGTTADFVNLAPNSDYLFRVMSPTGSEGTFDICLEAGPDSPGDSCDPQFSATAGESIAEPPIPCDEAQGGPGYPLDPACEAAICGADSFCCTNTWDGICATAAASEPACSGCLDVSSFATSTESTLDVVGPFPSGEIIIDLDVVVAIQHPDISELVIELESPCGTMITLQSEECAGGANMDALFNDTSSDTFTEFCVQRVGEVQPLEGLLAFNNQPIGGTWTLHVTDLSSGNVGTITDWCLVPTLDNGCPPPQIVVTDFTDNTITIDSDPGSCYDPLNYSSYDLTWTGGGSATGVTFPYQITGLTPGTLYVIDAISNCTVGGSSATPGGTSQTTLNCAPSELCTYELTLENTDGTGWDGAFATVDNGWTVTDYVMDPSLSTQTWTVLACPGNAISLSVSNGGNGALPNTQTISFVNSDDVEVYFEAGPPESTLYSQADGCPDCAAAINLEFTRLASDLVDVSWQNIALPANVVDIQVIVLVEDIFGSIEVANETFPVGTTSASVTLDASYPNTDVTVQVLTNCTNEGVGTLQEIVTLPGCDAASQCEYFFDMSSTDDGWGNTSLTALIDNTTSVEVALATGTSGTQSVFACPNGTIDVSANVDAGGGIPDDTCINGTQFGSATVTNNGNVVTITTCNFSGEFSNLTLNSPGQYEFTSSIGSDYFTLTDASNTVLAAGPTPLQAAVPTSGTYRLHVNFDTSCGSDFSCRATTAQYIGAGSAGCDSYSFSLVLNPDNVTLVSQTDFCDFETDDIVYSGSTCPSCFTPIDVVASTVGDLSAEFEWVSNNPAGTDYTVYVGLPGFTPGVDEVSSASGTTAATGAQGPVSVSGLSDDTAYEVIIVEDCGGEEADATLPVSFTTLVSGNVCATAIPLTVQAGGGCPAGSTTNSYADFTYSGEDISCIDFAVPPSVDAHYTFNSGGLNAVSLYVANTDAGFLVVDVYEGCTGTAVFCENGFGSPAIIAVDPNTDYVVRIITPNTNVGDHSICVSPPSGCTDPAALNYNDLADFDDGTCYSCGDATTLTVEANGFCPANETAQDMTGADNDLGNFIECVGNTVPLLDQFYTFNTGASVGVEITVSLGTMGFVAVEVYQDCVGDAIFCDADQNGGTYGPLGVAQNTDYTVRISTIAGQEGTYGICVQDATPPSGCTNPAAVNFDPIAGVDDGSCIVCAAGTNGVVLDMTDSFGDGWNGNTYTISDLSDPLNPVVVATGDLDGAFEGDGTDVGTDYLCLPDGCYEMVVDGGGFAGEVGWTLTGVDGGPVTGGSPDPVQFTINGTCPVLGCTNPGAVNFDPAATVDDSSCIIADCNDPGTPFTYCYGNNEDPAITNFTFVPTVPGDNIVVIFEQGTIENSAFDDFIVYDGLDDSAPVLYANPAATIQLDGAVLQSTLGNGLYITISTDGSVSCQSTGTYNEIIADIYCGIEVTPGCTDPSAVNFDAGADFNDGSCVFAPANDDCASAQALTPVTYPATLNALGTLAGASTDGSTACVGTNGSDVFYTFNVPLENHYWVNLNPFGGFTGVVEVLDACDGTVVACETIPSGPFCDVAQSPNSGFPSDPACEASVCGGDPFCCNTQWDGICAGDAAVDPNCTGCLTPTSNEISVFMQNLAPGDYIVRIRDFDGNSYLDATGQFLVNVQMFPFGGVQDNPNNFLYACNQGGFQLEDFVGATPQSGQGALDYQWYVYEEGGTFSNEWQRGEPNYVSRCTWLGMDYGTTYNVYVRILLDVPNVGPVWGVYPYLNPGDPFAVGAAECTISTATNVTPTEVRPNYTPTNVQGNNYALCDFVVAYNVSESQQFRWRFDGNNNFGDGEDIEYLGSNSPSVRLSWVDGLLPGATYNVGVEVRVDGNWSGYSTILPINLALPPNTVQLRSAWCDGSATNYVLSQSVCAAETYTFEFVDQGDASVHTFTSSNYVCFLNNLSPAISPGTYDVRVKVTQGGINGDFGGVCVVTIGSPTAPGAGGAQAQRDLTTTNDVALYPNPTSGEEVRLTLDGLSDGNHEVKVMVYDVYGKLISSDGFGHEGTELSRLIRFDENLAMGMYMVHIFVDGEQFAVERLVVK